MVLQRRNQPAVAETLDAVCGFWALNRERIPVPKPLTLQHAALLAEGAA